MKPVPALVAPADLLGDVARARQRLFTNRLSLQASNSIVKAAAAGVVASTPVRGTLLRAAEAAQEVALKILDPSPQLSSPSAEIEPTMETLRASRRACRLAVDQIRDGACEIAETRAEITRTTLRYDGPRPPQK